MCPTAAASSADGSDPMKVHALRSNGPTFMKCTAFPVLSACCALLWLAGGCAPQQQAADDWPEGTLVIARTQSLKRLLASLERLDGTLVARRAAVIAAALPDCEWLEGREASGSPADVWSQLRCRDGASDFPGLDAVRGYQIKIRPLTYEDFERARAQVQPVTSTEDMKRYTDWRDAAEA